VGTEQQGAVAQAPSLARWGTAQPVATAESHVSRLLSRQGARDRGQLVITAYERGLVTVPG